ncbi:MAG: glycoside hydrolase family 3 C-terminal domain-containing protein [Arachnia sp.]
MALDIDALIMHLSLAEKAALTSGSSFWYTTAVPRLGIPSILVSDGPNGLRAQPGEGDHVGLGTSLPATCFPPACATASTWNPALLRRIGEALGAEARAIGLSVILGPGINMKRSPLCGRNFEYFSEDPYLAGELAVEMVAGIQAQGVGTSLKHFAANNQETERLRVDAQVDERTLREIYFPAFERVITAAQPWTVMCAYNKVNGVSASQNQWLLTRVLREEWGFAGLVVSDWGAVYDRVPALRAGLDLEMPPALGRSPEAVVAAVEAGELDPALLDARARTVLELVDKAMPALADGPVPYSETEHDQLARQAAAESIVLLANDGILPLSGEQRIAVVGEFARTPRFQGAGSSQVNPTRVTSILDALAETSAAIRFAPGFSVTGQASPAEAAALLEEAVEVALQSQVVVLVMGLPAAHESEGFDRSHMELPPEQIAVLRAVAQANSRVVVVVVNGASVLLDDVVPHAAALLESWLGGQAAGGAVVDVLTGQVNPSGRLAESIPHRLSDNSSYLNFPGDSLVVRYGEGIFIGYRGYDAAGLDVAFPFGFGLSYTSFELADLSVGISGQVSARTLQAQLEVTVRNTGTSAGAHVVQVYVGDVDASVARPRRELKGFTKVWLDAGQCRRVSITLDQRAFAFWSAGQGRWVVEAGDFIIEVGHHSRDLPLAARVTIEAPSIAAPLTQRSTLQEWMADPQGRRIIEQAVAQGQPSAAMSQEHLSVIGSMPMTTLANFGGMSLDHDALDRAVADWQASAEPPSCAP